MKSIRRSLLVSILSGIVVSGLVCGGVLYQRMKGTLVSQFDSVLAAKVRALASMLDVDDGWLEFNYAADLMPEFEGGSDPEYFQISFADGRLLRKSATLGAAELPLCYGNVGAAELFDLVLPDGRAGRAIGVIAPVDLESDDDAPVTREEAAGERFDVHVVLVAARARAELDGALGALRDALWLAGTVLALLAGAVVLAGVRRGLRPLAALGQEVASIEAGSLSRRVSRRGLPLELDGMAAKLNELLARLEQAFQRERRVTGNIAHELRGPIAELRSAAEVALRWPDDPELARAAIEAAHAVAVHMGGLIGGLLRLARVAAGEAQLELEDVDLRLLVEELWAPLKPRASERALRFEHLAPPGLLLRTDRTLFASVVQNLLDNAVQHAPAGGTISCRAAPQSQGGVRWSLENPSDGLAAADLEHLTEPFWQKDPARSDQAHSGLGLTLVSTAAAALGLQLEFHLDARFRVTLRGGAA